MAQADDIKALQEQVKALTERLDNQDAAGSDDSRLASLEAQVEKIRAHTNAPA